MGHWQGLVGLGCSLGVLVSAGMAVRAEKREVQPALVMHSTLQKISFDLANISAEGLIGPPNGLRSLSYEFCIPAEAIHLAEIRQIDPTLQISRSRGRIGCQRNQYLVIGQTHNSRWREILLAIARLDYVQQIDQFFGE